MSDKELKNVTVEEFEANLDSMRNIKFTNCHGIPVRFGKVLSEQGCTFHNCSFVAPPEGRQDFDKDYARLNVNFDTIIIQPKCGNITREGVHNER